MLVIDASILIKLFRDEPDSHLARKAIEHGAEQGVQLLAPGLALYEVLAIALHYEVPFDIPIRLIEGLKQIGFALLEPTPEELRKAEVIATTRDATQGFPDLKDSIYHATAVIRGGIFLTADRRHFQRAQAFGNIRLLADWRPD